MQKASQAGNPHAAFLPEISYLSYGHLS
jgi:hypothetical protein